jgi:site-specific DNA recombinase
VKAVIYVRVSDDRQVENTSLAGQEQACRDWCAARNVDVDRVFRDAGQSAKTADRPAFQEMIRYTERMDSQLGYCVVYRFNRFARDQFDHVTYRTLLQRRNILLQSATEATDDSPFGRAAEAIISVFNQLDNEMRSEGTLRGMRARASAGAWQWKAPLGYVNEPKRNGEPSNLAIDPSRGPLVKKGFELLALGTHNKAEVLRTLTAQGLRSTTGREIRAQTFDRLIRNPVYAGRIVLPNWGLDTKGSFEPLISEDLFNRVQSVLDGKALPKVPHKRANEAFPLRGLLQCDICDKPVTASMSTGRHGGKFGYYRCTKNHLNVPASKVEQQFLELLDRLRPNEERILLVKTVFKAVWKQRHQNCESAVKALTKRRAELKEKKLKLLDAKLSGQIRDEDYHDFAERLNSELALVDTELHSVTVDEIDIDAALDWVERLLWNQRKLWLDSSLEAKQKLQNALFPNGLKLSKEGIGTPPNSSFYEILGADQVSENTLASPRGFEPLLSP